MPLEKAKFLEAHKEQIEKNYQEALAYIDEKLEKEGYLNSSLEFHHTTPSGVLVELAELLENVYQEHGWAVKINFESEHDKSVSVLIS